MANASAITIRDLNANGELAAPTADVLDTGTDPVTLAAAVGGKMDNLILRVENLAAQGLDVSVLAGDDPPAFRAGIGNFAATQLAQNAVAYLGPFESARFSQDNGDLRVTFTPGGTINAKVTAFRLPAV